MAKMVFKFVLLLFAVQSVHLVPARHVYQGFNALRNGREALTSNGFSQGAVSQGNRRQDIISGTTRGPLSGLSGNGFNQAQEHGSFQSGVVQGQSLPLVQNTGLNGAVGQPIGQAGGFGQANGFGQAAAINNALSQSGGLNSFAGFGQGNDLSANNALASQSQGQIYAQIEAQLAQSQSAGLNQGFLQGATFNQGFGLNQGLGFNQDLLQSQPLNQGATFNQGFTQSLPQIQNAAFNQDFAQSLPQNQGFNQQLFSAAPTNPPQFGLDASNGGLNPQIFTPTSPDISSNSFGAVNGDIQKPVEIGGKPIKNLQQLQSGNGGFANGEDIDGPIVTKDFYLHSAPDDIEDEELEYEKLKLGPSRKHYNVVFIKAPSLSAKAAALKLLQANSEEKTVIYVLNKQLDPVDIRANIKQLPSHVSKPEVFFIKYRTPEEAHFAQQKIQAQFDALGGTSRVSDEGISPITSVVGALNDQFGIDQQQLLNGQQQQQLNDQQQQQIIGQQQAELFANGKAGKFSTASTLPFQQGFADRSGQDFNSGEGIIEPRIGPGKPVELDGEAVGKVQNFGAAGQVDSSLLKRKLLPPINKPRRH